MSQSVEYAKIGFLSILCASVFYLATSTSIKPVVSSAPKSSSMHVPSAGSPPNSQTESAAFSDWDYIDGKKHVENERYKEAVQSFRMALKSNKRNSYAAYESGLANVELGNTDEAIADFTKAIEINPANKDFYFARAAAYREKKQFQKAVEDLQYVAKEIGDGADVQQNLALANIDNENFANALTILNDSIKKNGDDAYSWYLKGLCDAGLKKIDAAIEDYSKSSGLQDNYAEPLNNRGVIYLDREDYQKALNDFDRVIKTGHLEGRYYYNRSLAYKGLGRQALAEADLKKCKELKYDPDKDDED